MLEPSKPNVIYLNVKQGAIVRKTSDGEQTYKSVCGHITDVTKSTRVFNGESVTYWYVTLIDANSNEVYAVSFPYSSGAFRSLILQLVSDEGIQAVENQDAIDINVYLKDNYTKLQVRVNNQPLRWKTQDIPHAQVINVGNKVYKDDTERMKVIEGYVNQVAEICRLNKIIKR